jgi:hypothetical protein
MDLLDFFLLAIGVFFLIASYKNWDWFFKTVNPFGIPMLQRKGLRVLYAVLGLVIVGIVIYFLIKY